MAVRSCIRSTKCKGNPSFCKMQLYKCKAYSTQLKECKNNPKCQPCRIVFKNKYEIIIFSFAPYMKSENKSFRNPQTVDHIFIAFKRYTVNKGLFDQD